MNGARVYGNIFSGIIQAACVFVVVAQTIETETVMFGNGGQYTSSASGRSAHD